ncbi:hypothetical protein THAOC_07914, partial [Thalassiosira oceanica]
MAGNQKEDAVECISAKRFKKEFSLKFCPDTLKICLVKRKKNRISETEVVASWFGIPDYFQWALEKKDLL